jgi:hypothetical protein
MSDTKLGRSFTLIPDHFRQGGSNRCQSPLRYHGMFPVFLLLVLRNKEQDERRGAQDDCVEEDYHHRFHCLFSTVQNEDRAHDKQERGRGHAKKEYPR